MNLEVEKNTIIEYLKSADANEYSDIHGLSLSELIDELIDYTSEVELDYSILSTAFVNGVAPAKFENFYDKVMEQYESIDDGQEIPGQVLDRISNDYR